MRRLKLSLAFLRTKPACLQGMRDYLDKRWTEFQKLDDQLEYEMGRQIAAQNGKTPDGYSVSVIVD